jgi:Ni,Fe-hydrogenase III large subunit
MSVRGSAFANMQNGSSLPLARVPVVPITAFRGVVAEAAAGGAEIASLFAAPVSSRAFLLVAVLAEQNTGTLRIGAARVEDSWPSLTPDCQATHLFEREIAEQYSLRPVGHPWLKPVKYQAPMMGALPGAESGAGPGTAAPGIGSGPFFRVEGDEVHEVAVGPVHAGVIEPGHFRFQCHGEEILHLEISLGYQHRGVERAMGGGPTPRSVHYMETLAGDTTIGHAAAYCQALEALSGCHAPARAEVLRGVALELERLANHTGDLGALAGDVGYLPTASFCGRLRGDFLNMTALICGSRFGRGLVRPGGVAFDLDEPRIAELQGRLGRTLHDVAGAVNLLWESSSVLSRFEETGAVSHETAEALGLVGVAARASGLERDARFDFPAGVFRLAQIPVSVWQSGDVFARAWVRWLEIQRSAGFIREQLRALPDGPVRVPIRPLFPEHLAVSMVEGWRGELCHVALTDDAGQLAHYKVVDPSFHNWMGLAMAMRNQEISDFPLCNKSFNLSYCGHDL